MESYTIRILYRNRDNPEKFIGVVKGKQDRSTRGVVSMGGLWRILNTPRPGWDAEKADSPEARGRRSREELLDLFYSLREG